MDEANIKNASIWQVSHSLKNSVVRSRVYNWLCEISPEGATPEELAATLKHTETNILGAIEGDGKRYKETDSLVHLGLARCERVEIHGHYFNVYHATEYGLEIRERLNNLSSGPASD